MNRSDRMKMKIALAAIIAAGSAGSAFAQSGPIRIGVLNDQSGLYAEFGGIGSVTATKMAIEDFGGNSFRIESLPAFLEVTDVVRFLREIIDELKLTSRSSSPMRLGEDMIATTVCRHAVKANDLLRNPEIEKLIRDLLACELPYCCPHGRPTMIQISLAELEKKFGRKV